MEECVFDWQISQLIDNISCNYSEFKTLEKSFWTLKCFLEQLPSLSFVDARALLADGDVVVPFSSDLKMPTFDENFVLDKPSSVRVVGSFMLKTVIDNDAKNADIVFEIPATLFSEKDYINYVYPYKRAFYLAYIAALLKMDESAKNVTISFDFLCGDLLRPILKLTSADYCDFQIRIIPSISESTFKLARLSPSKNGVRPYLFEANDSPSDPSSWPATPRYNSSIIADTLCVAHLNYLYHYMKTSDEKKGPFQKTIMLLKAWSQLRGHHLDGFDSHVISMITACMFATKKCSYTWSASQCFRVILNWVSQSDLIALPVYMTSNGAPVNDFKDYQGLSLVDPSGKLNLLSHMTNQQYDFLKHSAKMSLSLLQAHTPDAFPLLFLKKQSYLSFDNFARVDASDVKTSMKLPERLNYGTPTPLLTVRIGMILQKALGNRVVSMMIRSSPFKPWELNELPSSFEQTYELGILFNPKECNRTIDYGPSAEDEQAATEFRKIWGDKSELRRFPDGTVLEAVLWDMPSSAPFDERSTVVEKVVSYILARHFGITSSCIKYHGNQVFSVLKPSRHLLEVDSRFRETYNSFSDVAKSFDLFARKLKDLEGLPLVVVELRPSHSGLRSSSLGIPQPRTPSLLTGAGVPPYLEALDVVMQLETSNRWPLDLAAIQKTKASFLCEMAKLINDGIKGFRAMVVRGKTSPQDVNGESIHAAGSLEITEKDGLTYRCQIIHDYELVILKNERLNPQTTDERKIFLDYAIQEYKYELIDIPFHSQFFQAAVHTYPQLSTVTRLVKRWVSSHWINIRDEAIELVCKSVYENNPPGTAWSGFLSVLTRLADWDFLIDPLVVVMQGKPATARLESIKQEHAAWRKNDVNVSKSALYVVAYVEEDIFEGEWDVPLWTEGVSRIMLSRLQGLAKSTLKSLANNFDGQFESFFAHPTSAYDIILDLQPALCARYHEAISPTSYVPREEFKNDVGTPAVDFDPVRYYYEELLSLYGDLGLICYDKHGGIRIGIAFNPQMIKQPVPYRKSIKYPVRISTHKGKKFAAVDLAQLVKDMKIRGGNLVKEIKLHERIQKLVAQTSTE